MKQRAIPGESRDRPRLSVVMPVRDLAPYVEDSIRSILGQSFADFEFVILDDGSTDGTREILRAWQVRDSRIRLFEGREPLGPALSSNFVVAKAHGEIVARMDGDDIAHPDRLRRQLAALDADPGACLAGTLWEGIDEKGRRVRPRDRWRLVHGSPFAPFAHGSIMFRRTAFERAGGYRREADFWEDLDLYGRMAPLGRLIVIPEVLYQHRASLLSTRLTSSRRRVEQSVDLMYRRARGLAAAPAGARLLPRVFLSLGSTRIWAGRRPESLSRLLRHGALRLDAESAAILVWAAWGALSPRSLRLCLSAGVMLRDRRVRHLFADDAPWRWQPVAVPERTDEPDVAGLRRTPVAAG
ncbi:MAG TPA: glycosyltransferase family A protein [Allosphingosinicella sp.]|nr:glycosyltransferase family A protein [Allosphingosinicella sp.]